MQLQQLLPAERISQAPYLLRVTCNYQALTCDSCISQVLPPERIAQIQALKTVTKILQQRFEESVAGVLEDDYALLLKSPNGKPVSQVLHCAATAVRVVLVATRYDDQCSCCSLYRLLEAPKLDSYFVSDSRIVLDCIFAFHESKDALRR